MSKLEAAVVVPLEGASKHVSKAKEDAVVDAAWHLGVALHHLRSIRADLLPVQAVRSHLDTMKSAEMLVVECHDWMRHRSIPIESSLAALVATIESSQSDG